MAATVPPVAGTRRLAAPAPVARTPRRCTTGPRTWRFCCRRVFRCPWRLRRPGLQPLPAGRRGAREAPWLCSAPLVRVRQGASADRERDCQIGRYVHGFYGTIEYMVVELRLNARCACKLTHGQPCVRGYPATPGEMTTPSPLCSFSYGKLRGWHDTSSIALPLHARSDVHIFSFIISRLKSS